MSRAPALPLLVGSGGVSRCYWVAVTGWWRWAYGDGSLLVGAMPC